MKLYLGILQVYTMQLKDAKFLYCESESQIISMCLIINFKMTLS